MGNLDAARLGPRSRLCRNAMADAAQEHPEDFGNATAAGEAAVYRTHGASAWLGPMQWDGEGALKWSPRRYGSCCGADRSPLLDLCGIHC